MSQEEGGGEGGNEVYLGLPCGRQKSLIRLELKSMIPCREKTELFRSSQQLPRHCLGPLEGAVSAQKALQGSETDTKNRCVIFNYNTYYVPIFFIRSVSSGDGRSFSSFLCASLQPHQLWQARDVVHSTF